MAKIMKVNGSLKVNQSIIAEGDLLVKGTTTSVAQENLLIKDNLVVVAKDNTTALVTPAGLLAKKYDGTNDGALVFDADGTAYIGDVALNTDGTINTSNSDLQPLATREEEPTAGGFAKWDSSTKKFVTDTDVASLTKLKKAAHSLVLSGTSLLLKDANEADAALSTITQTDLRTAIATGVSANESSFIFPKYNSTGLITGAAATAKQKAMTLNGTSLGSVYGTSDTGLTLYAPTASGDNNQVLTSKGVNNAPVWVNQSDLAAGKATNDKDGNAIDTTYLKKSGGTMDGQLILSQQGFRTSQAEGYYLNEWGNLKCLSSSDGAGFNAYDYNNKSRLTYFYNTGEMKFTKTPNVNGTPVLLSSGGDVTGNLYVSGKYGDNYIARNVLRVSSTAESQEIIIKTKIKFVNSSRMPLIRLYGYNYRFGAPFDIAIGFYMYADSFFNSGVTSNSKWRPYIYLFTYTEGSVEYVAIGIRDLEDTDSYYLGFQVDVQIPCNATLKDDTTVLVDGWSFEAYNNRDNIPAIGVNKCVNPSYGDRAACDIKGNNIHDTYFLKSGGTVKGRLSVNAVESNAQELFYVESTNPVQSIDWVAGFKAPFNSDASNYGVGIRLRNGGYSEHNKWSGIVSHADSSYANVSRLELWANKGSAKYKFHDAGVLKVTNSSDALTTFTIKNFTAIEGNLKTSYIYGTLNDKPMLYDDGTYNVLGNASRQLHFFSTDSELKHNRNGTYYDIITKYNIGSQTVSAATKATNDSDGNAINTTYLKKSGGTISGDLSVTGQVKFPNDVPTNNSPSWIYVCNENNAKNGFAAVSLSQLKACMNVTDHFKLVLRVGGSFNSSDSIADAIMKNFTAGEEGAILFAYGSGDSEKRFLSYFRVKGTDGEWRQCDIHIGWNSGTSEKYISCYDSYGYYGSTNSSGLTMGASYLHALQIFGRVSS